MKRIFLTSSLIFLIIVHLWAQTGQIVKGQIIDHSSKAPVVGANIILAGSDPVIGSSTDVNGEFRIENVPIGHVTLLVSCIGYEPTKLQNITVGAGKEVILTINVSESLLALDEVVITDRQNKSDVSNEMVQVSGRTFSVEETKRYAGAFNDPARMVTSFAGVQGSPGGDNYIVVRGNSPNTVQWRLNDVVIPNPNHFAEEGESGGAINMLNSTMLSNSDFYTGAFTSDYGNVMGAVFDIRLRTGNRDKREYSLGVGILGTDITMEGPFVKNKNSSYLVNYRYSTLSLLDKLGIIDFGGVPKYQDLSFSLSFPTKKAGTFSLSGLGGLSSIKEESFDQDDILTDKSRFTSFMGTIILNHVIFLTKNSSLESYISFSNNGSKDHANETRESHEDLVNVYKDKLDKSAYRIGTTFNSKIDAKNSLRAGVRVEYSDFSFDEHYRNKEDELENWLNDKGSATLTRSFVSFNHRFNRKWSATGGLNYEYLDLNGQQAVEPRMSFKYEWENGSSLSGGFGLHSQMTTLPAYYSSNEGERTNLDLEFMKAAHFVLSYDRHLKQDLYFKSELYFQNLYDIPVEDDITSSFSMLNSIEGLIHKRLVSKGKGKNYGLEVTLEKYFSDRFYFLITGSLYNSSYKALDGIQRNTRFNANYLTNFLFGKEFTVGQNGDVKKKISLNSRFNLAGRSRYLRVDADKSREEGYTIFIDENAFEEKGPVFIRWDLSVAYGWNRKHTRQEVKFDVQNVTNNQALVGEYYDSIKDTISKDTQLPLFPVISYIMEF